MKKVNLSLSLEQFKLNSSEMKIIKGGGCSYSPPLGNAICGVSEGEAQSMVESDGGNYCCGCGC